MYADMGYKVLAADLDPQANLSAMFLSEGRFESLLDSGPACTTILGCVMPLLQGRGDIAEPFIEEVDTGVGRVSLLVGDPGLATLEGFLSEAWHDSRSRDVAALRAISAFSRIIEPASLRCNADVVLIDVGSNLGAVNRTALLAADDLVIPLVPDLFAARGLRTLGPALRDWRAEWQMRLADHTNASVPLPSGKMRPAGYVVVKRDPRPGSSVGADSRRMARIPRWYREFIKLGDTAESDAAHDPNCLALLKNYSRLTPLAEEARKPMFALKVADGALGAFQYAVSECYDEFSRLAARIATTCHIRRTAEIS
jgi:cellulose biosynthesis protein BcsQ